ncbi:putative baseplate hub subunit protein [Rhizobium phage RHph_I1_18]|nr:putative baseplate hub subunit protein [Rhizobium phage RHph_I1_18]
MALPKLKTPLYNVTLPLSKKQVVFRPYNLGDEKLLIAASQARDSDPQFFVDNTLKVVSNCISDTEGLVDRLPGVDVEYLLMMLRARSVGETTQVQFTDPETKKVVKTEIDLTAFFVNDREKSEYVIKLSDEIALKMREPTFRQKTEHAIKYKGKNNATDIIYELIADSVESIADGDDVHVIGVDATREELMEFLLGITTQKVALYQFIRSAPQLKVKLIVEGKELEVAGNQVDFLNSPTPTSTR